MLVFFCPLQSESSAKVDVNKETKKATITGAPEAVQKAAELVTAIVAKQQAVIDSKVCSTTYIHPEASIVC